MKSKHQCNVMVRMSDYNMRGSGLNETEGVDYFGPVPLYGPSIPHGVAAARI